MLLVILFQPDKHLKVLPANCLVETTLALVPPSFGGKEAPELGPTDAAFEFEKGFLPLPYGKFPFIGL